MSAVTSPTAWIDPAPSQWTVAPLGTHFDERSETVSDAEFQPLSVTRNGVVPQLEHVAKTDNNANRKLVRTGDFAINSRSDRKGSAGLSEFDGSVSVVYTVLTPRPSIDGRFAHHLLRSTAFQEEFYRWGSGIVEDLWSTRYSAMKRIPLAIPPTRRAARHRRLSGPGDGPDRRARGEAGGVHRAVARAALLVGDTSGDARFDRAHTTTTRG